ncbi:hypothetical protein GCM10020254_32120 [Streptomyces goshikiensis]
MYPKVKPALARAWRDLQTVQFGVTPAHAVVLGPVDTATGSLIDRIDGTRGMELLRKEAAGMGLPEGQVAELVRRLAGGRGCSMTPRRADRAPRRCGAGRRPWSGSGPTWPRSRWCAGSPAGTCAGSPPAGPYGCRCAAAAGWAR